MVTRSVLVDLQRTALSANPRIKAMEAEAQMMKKRIPQSTALEDPKLKLGINNLSVTSPSFTKEDMTSKEIGISQMIPLGKLPVSGQNCPERIRQWPCWPSGPRRSKRFTCSA